MVASTLYYGSLRTLGVTSLSRAVRNAGLILCYHNVVTADEEGIGDPSLHVPRDEFARQMGWLAGRYEMVSLSDFLTRLESGGDLRELAAVTFDDGYRGVFDNAVPVLAALSIPATVFVVAEAVALQAGFWWDCREIVSAATPEQRQRWLGELQGDGRAILADVSVRAMVPDRPALGAADWKTIKRSTKVGIEIGVHSATHRALPTLPERDLEHEVVTSREIIADALGLSPTLFAYPYGLVSPATEGAVRAAGYRAACGLGYGLNDARADPWCLRRVNVPAGISDAAFEAWVVGLRRPWSA